VQLSVDLTRLVEETLRLVNDCLLEVALVLCSCRFGNRKDIKILYKTESILVTGNLTNTDVGSLL